MIQAIENEERRKERKPTTTIEEASLLASSLYGVSSSALLKPLDSYDDRNFYVPPYGGNPPFLLKVHNGVESENRNILEAQNAMMTFLSAHGLTCSEPIKSIHGRIIEYTTISNRTFAVRMLTWVRGRTLNSLEPTVERLLLSGRYLGELRTKLDQFDHPGCHRDHLWDIRQTLGLRGFLHALNDVPNVLAAATAVVDEFEEIQEKLKGLKWGTLQADFNDTNIIFNEQGTEVVGVIDFGDIVYSNRINDLAIAMAYIMLRCPKHLNVVQTCSLFLQGYCETADIDPEELDVLRTLVGCRLACSVTLGAFSSLQDKSGNEYLTLHAAPGRHALLQFTSFPKEEIHSSFHKAVDNGKRVKSRLVRKRGNPKSRQIMLGAAVLCALASIAKGQF
jgi:hydroxylysine kinase